MREEEPNKPFSGTTWGCGSSSTEYAKANNHHHTHSPSPFRSYYKKNSN
jgi:hypothetical protein